MGNSDDPKRVPPKAGRVVHDERGNAVWDWVVETGRIFVDSTSRLLRKLEAPELKLDGEETTPELGIESDRDAGGGYDPYGRSNATKTGGANGPRGAAGNGGKACGGGGYDPYSKGVVRKPGRK
jgi:hypothetical protein